MTRTIYEARLLGAARLHREDRKRKLGTVAAILEGILGARPERRHDDKSRRAPWRFDPRGNRVARTRLGAQNDRTPVPYVRDDFLPDDETLEPRRVEVAGNGAHLVRGRRLRLRNRVGESFDRVFNAFGRFFRERRAGNERRRDEGVASDGVGQRERDGRGISNREVRRGDHRHEGRFKRFELLAFTRGTTLAFNRRGDFFRLIVRRLGGAGLRAFVVVAGGSGGFSVNLVGVVLAGEEISGVRDVGIFFLLVVISRVEIVVLRFASGLFSVLVGFKSGVAC